MSLYQDNTKAVLELLCERFPKTFFLFERRRRPLKLGIRDDIIAALGDAIEPKLLGAALRRYTTNLFYLRAQQQGASRIDLTGNVAGEVSEEEAKQAIARKAYGRPVRKAAAVKPTVPETPPPPEPSKRLGLADLKAAAASRRKSQAAAG